jgi:thiosulfate reductase cytochrome b subunit
MATLHGEESNLTAGIDDLENLPPKSRVVFRHRLSTRLWHWVNVVAFFIMVMSGLMIFNAHPRLYWGQYGANFDHSWFQISGQGQKGYLRIGSVTVETTGVLGKWRDSNGVINSRAFPGWATIPSHYNLAAGRLWHLFFAWVLAVGLLAYLLTSLWNRHIQDEIAPTADEVKPAHVWQDIKDHARLRFPTGEAATRYNILQKMSYGLVLLILLPLMVLTGLSMSPGTNAFAGGLVELFGGRASARSIHFIVMWLLLGFFLVHVAMVILAGPINEVRSMFTGRYAIKPDRPVAIEESDDAEPAV